MTKLQYPAPIEARRLRMQTLLASLDSIGQVILGALAAAMRLAPACDFSQRHRPDRPSTSTFGMLRYPTLSADDAASAGHAVHTDEGTLTILFASDYGLQTRSAATQRWAFVEPRTGHAVVNLGDSLRFLSGGRLKACLHRVAPLPGRTILERYSLAYFMRPEDDACFTDTAGRAWTSTEWHIQRFSAHAQVPV
ncbi:gibberellin 3-beta [Cordyceps militaris]|uniref:Gibberellin 3-beta n=1 Tax=Cordyceps militaris TaxID=73501 RepID=A0A2H4SDG6_CORMI|nr:gibberellin 3-beta [Cordyceps militaris]